MSLYIAPYTKELSSELISIDTFEEQLQSIKSKTKLTPSLSTSGGTSDARFIQAVCPVVEFGVVGKSMHKTDENVEIKQIIDLSEIYERILSTYFTCAPGKN